MQRNEKASPFISSEERSVVIVVFFSCFYFPFTLLIVKPLHKAVWSPSLTLCENRQQHLPYFSAHGKQSPTRAAAFCACGGVLGQGRLHGISQERLGSLSILDI